MTAALRALQLAWAAHVRDPSRPPPPGVDPARLALYRTLCVNSVESLLTGSFPRLCMVLGEAGWRRAIEDFYRRHRCDTPLFPRVAGEFAAWLAESDTALPPWAAELADYEWSRHALLFAEATAAPVPVAEPALDVPLALSPLAHVRGYHWPVHVESALPLDTDPPPAAPTLLLLRRDEDHVLRTDRLSPFAYRLLQAIATGSDSARAHLSALAHESGTAAADMLAHGQVLLAELWSARIVVTASDQADTDPFHPDRMESSP
ncbi:DUF2063 domain-containing protein [Cystobacter fuscus]|uniref:HvfC family RiPP maturation protein n=1 Tax=Cystobacter fuscus TaxID=43 RepID=UPI002B2CE365|nr:DUF2063 domain-containing protein [Cystobacter fuscus]